MYVSIENISPKKSNGIKSYMCFCRRAGLIMRTNTQIPTPAAWIISKTDSEEAIESVNS